MGVPVLVLQSSGRSDIFCSWTAPCFRQVTQFAILDATADVPPITQNPLAQIAFKDMPWPWCWTFSWKYLMIRLVTWPFLRRMTGNFVSSVKCLCWIQPPTHSTPSWSRNGLRWYNELVAFMALFFCCADDLSCPSWKGFDIPISLKNVSFWAALRISLLADEPFHCQGRPLMRFDHLSTPFFLGEHQLLEFLLVA